MAEAAKEDDNYCQMKTPVCVGQMHGMHHLKKRAGKMLLNKKFMLRSCNPCNNWVEANPTEAMAMGLVLSKFS